MYGGSGVDPNSREQIVERTFAVETDATKFGTRIVQHFCDQFSFAKAHARAFFQPAAGPHQCFPNIRLDLTHEEDLDVSACFAMAGQSRGNYARVVYDDHIVGTKMTREFFEARISPCLLVTIEHEHSRSISRFERRLRDEISWKLVIEIRDVHLHDVAEGMFAVEDGGELGAKQQYQTRNITPGKYSDDSANRSIDLIVVKIIEAPGEDVLRYFP